MVSAFEGNKAETKTMLPVIKSFMAAHQLPDLTVVADAGMVSEANQKQIEAAGLSFILGAKIPYEPCVVKRWRRKHPGEQIPDGHVFTQPCPPGRTAAATTGSSTTVSRWIEATAGWSIRKFVKTGRRYRTVQIQAGDHIITAADPLPADLRDGIEAINADRSQGG